MVPIIECHHLSKNYKDKLVLNNINFSLEKGEILCIVGPSGCGKTTLLRLIAGLEQLTAGTIFLEGNTINDVSAQARPVVMMFQQPLLFPHLTVLENTVYGLRMKKLPKKESLVKALDMLKSMEVEQLANSYPHEISGGQQQRVALARALIVQPKLLLLDEPFSSLDPDLRSSLRSWTKRKLKEWDITAIFVTHDKEEAMVLADKLAVMKDGVIHQIGILETLYKNPATEYVASYLSEGFLVENLFIPFNKVTLTVNQDLTSNGFQQVYRGIVAAVFYKGGQKFIQLDLTDLQLDITIACHIDVSLGDTAYISVNTEDMVSFIEGEK